MPGGAAACGTVARQPNGAAVCRSRAACATGRDGERRGPGDMAARRRGRAVHGEAEGQSHAEAPRLVVGYTYMIYPFTRGNRTGRFPRRDPTACSTGQTRSPWLMARADPWYLKGGTRGGARPLLTCRRQLLRASPPPNHPLPVCLANSRDSHRARRWPILLSLVIVLASVGGGRVARMDNADPSDSLRLAA
jgi:hypothetical protein